MYQRPEGLSHLIAPQMRPEECGGQAGRQQRKKAAPPTHTLTHTPFFTISVAFLKGYIQGHVTFRGLNKKKKKKEFILLQNVLFFLYSLCGLLRPVEWQWGWLGRSLSVTFLSS